jgi:hypothetical protein
MPELDRQGIAEILDIDVTDVPTVNITNEPAPTGSDEPRTTLNVNIVKANSILSLIEAEMVNGNFSARLAEVASLVINSITTAAAQIMINDTNKESLHLKRSMVELKHKELEIKERLLLGRQQQESTGRDRLVITDRETVLKFLKDDREKNVKQIVGGQDDD